MTLGDLERLELMIATTGRLSHQMQIRLPDHWEPQIKQAIYIAKSSCQSMLIPRGRVDTVLGKPTALKPLAIEVPTIT